MPQANKSFLLGCLLGATLGTFLLIGSLVGVALLFQAPLSRVLARQQEAGLRPPVFGPQMLMELNWRVEGMDGSVLDMASLAGKPVFLHLWKPDCVPCLSELPSLSRLHAALTGSGVEVVTVVPGTAYRGDVALLSIDFPVYFTDQLPEVFRSGGTPATFVLDAAGHVVFSHRGSARWDDAATVAYLRSLGPGET